MLRVRTTFGGIQGTPYVSTMHFIGSGSVDAAAAVTAVAAFWNGVDSLMVTACEWQTEPDVEELDAAGALQAIHTTSIQQSSGQDAGQPLPYASQALVRWRTGNFTGGRNLRGRTFIPGLAETVSDGTLTTTAQSTIQTAAAALVGASAQLGVWSRRYSAIHEVLGASVSNQLAVLRSRRD